MKIVEIRSAVAVVPLTKPVGWATAAVTEREYILVWVVGEDGSYRPRIWPRHPLSRRGTASSMTSSRSSLRRLSLART